MQTALRGLRDFLYARFSDKCLTHGDDMLFTCLSTSHRYGGWKPTEKSVIESFFFFFFKRVSQPCLLKKTIKKDLKKRRPHWQGEKFFRVEGNSPTRATLLGQLSIQYRYFLKKDSNRLLGKQKVGSARRMTHLTGSRFLGQHLGRANFSPNKHLGSFGQGKTETEHASALF